ncbi:MAG: radical SAM protein [Bdellovibrionota bacterium]
MVSRTTEIDSGACGRLAEKKQRTIDSFRNFISGSGYPKWPLELTLEVSHDCTLQCAMCEPFSKLKVRRSSLPPLSGFFPLKNLEPLRDVLEHTLFVHCAGQGEPTLHPDFTTLMSVLSDFETLIDFSTNGLGLTDQLCRFLVQRRIFSVGISLSGSTKKDYENVYHGGTYETVIEGIRRLADAKKRCGSLYPLIEINSLAFEHHIQHIGTFVEQMAELGVNRVHVRPLVTSPNIPALAGHAVVCRPHVELELLRAASARGRTLGVELVSDYLNPVERPEPAYWSGRKRTQYEKSIEAQLRKDRPVPIELFPSLRQTVPPDSFTRQPPPPEPQAHGELLRAYLDIRAVDELDTNHPLYCMEPFTGLYVRQNGEVTTCAFAAAEAPRLGTVVSESGAQIWCGERSTMVRDGILENLYPHRACATCVQQRLGPQQNTIAEKVAAYIAWRKHTTSEALISPDHDHLVMTNSAIAARLRETSSMQTHRKAEAPGLSASTALRTAIDPRLELLRNEIETRLKEGRSVDDLVRGNLDGRHADHAAGWVRSQLFPDLRLEVEIYIDGKAAGSTCADQYRPDLWQLREGDGMHAFRFVPPPSIPGVTRRWQAKLSGTSWIIGEKDLEL